MYNYASIFCINFKKHLPPSEASAFISLQSFILVLRNVSQVLSSRLIKRFPHMPHRPFLDSRHIGPGDPELFRDLPLCVFLCPEQSISHADHGLLHLREILLVRLVEDLHVLLDDHSLKDFPVRRLKDIQEAHGLPILIRADGIVDGDFPGKLFSGPEHH